MTPTTNKILDCLLLNIYHFPFYSLFGILSKYYVILLELFDYCSTYSFIFNIKIILFHIIPFDQQSIGRDRLQIIDTLF